MEDGGGDLSAWTNPLPGKSCSQAQSVLNHDAGRFASAHTFGSPDPSISSLDSEVIEVSQANLARPDYESTSESNDDSAEHKRRVEPMVISDGEGRQGSIGNEPRPARKTRSRRQRNMKVGKQHGLVITPPTLTQEEYEEYEELPSYYSVNRVLYMLDGDGPDQRFIVELASGEVDLLSRKRLNTEFHRGRQVLAAYRSPRSTFKAVNTPLPPILPSGSIDWRKVQSLVDGEGGRPRADRKAYTEEPLSDLEPPGPVSSGDDFEDDDGMRPGSRRSTRLVLKGRSNYLRTEPQDWQDFSDSDLQDNRRRQNKRPKRTLTKLTSRAARTAGADSSERRAEVSSNARRSGRARAHPDRSMRERQEDDFSSQSEKGLGTKIVATKEVFERFGASHPFRKRHQQQCSTCYHGGDSDVKGPLVFCQGCSNTYHKTCLGPRGSRDHLVTKVGNGTFVLQCRRCVGVAHAKDQNAPHHGCCVACNKLGSLSKPLRRRLTPTQEQIQREENGGIDPITIIQPGIIDDPENVMFRCATCNRAWHLHHMPNRKTANAGDSDEEDLDQAQLAQKRFDMYYRSWICKDCVENQHPVDVLVAWRPSDQESYVPGTTLGHLSESEKEYLVKWKKHSYLRCTWMPGTWIWGVVPAASRVAFTKRPEKQLPRMTTKDAIPEEFHRIDIVFDVHYTSVVRNSSEQIDLARVKEVDTALVKFKGLTFEDSIWEKPPVYADKERFMDFKDAYEDYVRKRYMSIPTYRTLQRNLVAVRQQDFETKLIQRTQPSELKGGTVMQYQLEGLNWLYYQWYRQHNAILADEMGLGKTIQLIALMVTMVQEHKCWPFLIVVPNSTCPNWRREIKKWAPNLRAVCYYGSSVARKMTHDYELFPKDKDKDAETDTKKKIRVEHKDIKAHVVITSYESIIDKNVLSSLARVPWQGLIVDEGQRLKNDQNLVYEALAKIRFPYKVLMTGTPLQNNARELFNLLQFLDKDKHNAAELEKEYSELTDDNVPELHEMLKPYFLRRTKVQVLTFLPPMSQIIVPVSMSALQRQVSRSIMSRNPTLMKSIFSRDESAPVKDRTNLNNILLQLRKALCHPFVYSRGIEDRSLDGDASFKTLVEASSKLQLLSIMLPKLRERGHRVLLFSQFLDNLDIMEDFLDGLGMLFKRLDGTISALEKQKRIDEFNAPNSPYFAFLLSTRAGGVGINLATADTVIILDPDFNPHQDIQALSRAHRIGQQNKVLVFQLMTRVSPEEKIMQIGKKKMALDHVLIESMDQEDDAGMDLESILRHGAAALFDDKVEEDIAYSEVSVDKLLDRSQMESTKTSEGQTAESQFSFARIWANDKSTLEEGLIETSTGTSTPNPDLWDKILRERQKAFEEEEKRKAQELGRGKRKRGTVDYGGRIVGDSSDSPVKNRDSKHSKQGSADPSDDDFEDGEVVVDTDVGTTAAEDTEPEIEIVKAQPFKRVKVPIGQAPTFNGDVPLNYIQIPVPPPHKCLACKDEHPMGWCRLKIAGVEHCGLCGLAHMGHGRTCPHLNDEKQVETLLMTLKQSTESRELIDEATKYLKMIRGDLVSRRRFKERKAQQERDALLRTQAPNPTQLDRDPLFQPVVGADLNSGYRNAAYQPANGSH